MSIEEAENILNEAVITEPSINSYTYISAEQINQAIDKVLEEKRKDEEKIKELERNIIREENKLEKIIKENEIKPDCYPIQTPKNRRMHIKKIIKYFKKVVKHSLGFWKVEL